MASKSLENDGMVDLSQSEKPHETLHVEKDTASNGSEGSPAPYPGRVRHAFSIDPLVEKRLVRKMDWRIVPLVSALYLLSFIDRSNIGNARIAGMTEDLNLYGNRYQWLLNIFYIPYIIFEFGVIGWKIFPPHIWAAVMVFGWGVAASAQAGAFNWAGEMVCRWFLAMFEANYGPGIPYLLSFFYLRHELGFRAGIFLSAAPLATCFAGALAYGITSGHAQIANWRLLFLVEGLPTIAMAVVVFFFLPDSPEKARFLTDQEREMARSRTIRQVGANVKRQGGIDWADVLAALKDPKNWFTAFIYFSLNVSFSSLPVFLPEVLKGMGFTAIHAQGLTAPPYFISFLITFSSCYVADRLQQRGLVIMLLSAVGGVGFIMLVAAESVGVRYAGVFLAAAGIFPSIANTLSWVLNNQGSDTRRGVGIAMLNTIGQCGPLLGTNVFGPDTAPRYIKGFAICAAFTFLTTALAFGLRTLLVWENKQLDKKYGPRGRDEFRTTNVSGEEQTSAESGVGEENYGPNFRYIL